MAKREPRSDSQDEAGAARTARPKRAKAGARASASTQTAGIGETGNSHIGFGESDTPARVAEAADDRRSTSMASEPSEEDIRMRAYHRYLERGGGHGMDFEDWLEAERELKQRR